MSFNACFQTVVLTAKETRTAEASRSLAKAENSLFIQPNPASTQLRIEYALEQAEQDGVLLSIYDSNGRLMQTNEFLTLQGVQLVSVQNWSPGIYSVLLKNSKGKILNSKRLVD